MLRKYILGFISFFLLLLGQPPVNSYSAAASFQWRQVPLRYKAQKMAGLTGGEGLQEVYAIVYADSDPNIVYLSADTSRVWKSENGGESWHPANKGFSAHGARSLIVDPVNADIVFAAGFGGRWPKDALNSPNHLQGIFRTADGGQHWDLVKRVDFNKQRSKGSLFAFDSASSHGRKTFIAYCGTYNAGLLRTNNGGYHWKCVGFRKHHIINVIEDPAKPGNLFVSTENGLFRYENGAIIKTGFNLPDWPRSIAVSPASPGVIYAALGTKGIFKSIDGGRTFSACSIGFFPNVFFSDIAVSRFNPNMVYIRADRSSLRPLYSHDGGRTWNWPITTDLGDLIEKEGFYFSSPFAVHPLCEKTAITVSNGKARILKTIDGGQRWRYCGSGFTGGHVEDIAFYGPGKMIFALTDFGLWRTEDNGATFRELPVKRMMGQRSSSAVAFKDDTIVTSIGSWAKKVLAVGRRNGRRWSYFPDLTGCFKFIGFNQDKNGVIYADAYRSRDNGYTWKKLSVAVRAIDPNDGNTIYGFAPTLKKTPGTSLLMKSIDQGDSWRHQICPFGFKEVQDFDVAPDGWLFAATSRGLWIFDGKTWTVRNQRNGLDLDNFGMCFISGIQIDPKKRDRLFVSRRAPGYGKSNGIFMSQDRGDTWENISGNLGQKMSASLIKVDPYSGTAYIGTYAGTWRHQPVTQGVDKSK